MTSRKHMGFLLGMAYALSGALALLGTGQVVELKAWPLPGMNALPMGIGVAPDGKVYFTEFNLNKIGLLDPTTDEIREREVGRGPFGLVVGEHGSLYYTVVQDNAVEALVFIGGGAKWAVPAPAAFPEVLVAAPTGPGQVNLWLNERNAGKVARFAPAQVFVTMPLIITQPTVVHPDVSQIQPVVSPVTPEVHPGNPLLPPPIALLVPTASGPFTEWQAMDQNRPVQRVAVAPDGRVWFTQGLAPLAVLDPPTNTVLLYGIPTGTNALAITVGLDGLVWFTDTNHPAIGALDPTTGDVQLWRIPGGQQPFDLALDGLGNVWFTDRAGDAVGYLSPARSEITLYGLAPNSHPVFLALDEAGAVWFTAERGNFVGRLSVVPVLGEPPALPSGVVFTDYSVVQVGNRAWASVSYTYDGGHGVPIWVGVEVLAGGVPISGFVYLPVRVDHPGPGTANFVVEYRGQVLVQSDAVRFTIALSPGGAAFAAEEIEFTATWTP
ncbi:hypothetical protein H5T53_06910 [Candidatus Bipolaricaulota bacterium]|nr:hypothetical protein [Candidatus Bipolaricaulota bacterium]